MEHAIKNMARSLGFTACGIAKAAPVDAAVQHSFRRWLAEGCQGTMEYLERNVEKRMDPARLVEGCRSLIVVALNYYPAETIPEDEYQLAYYAYGRDYHEVVRNKLTRLLTWLNTQRSLDDTRASNLAHAQRVFVDTAPVLERYWAQQAGLGWTGRNHQLILPEAGSYFVLGILTTDLSLQPDIPMESRCGDCRRCLDACPTKALSDDASFDARCCLSYLTIEQKSTIPSEFSASLGNRIYGCDTCQKACPWNRFARPTGEPSFAPSPLLLKMTKADWHTLSREQYNVHFAESAVTRAGYDGLQRTIRCVQKKEE
jgi:epoxyqueuosine reductase